jgi:hypothetical protein
MLQQVVRHALGRTRPHARKALERIGQGLQALA